MPILEQEIVTLTACPSRHLLDQIADKWTILVLLSLWDRPRRFNAIKRTIEGITQKALTQTLRRLERNGLITRQVVTASPIAVEYSVTELGRTLKHPLQAMHVWTTDYLPEVERAQQRFDATHE